MRTELGFGTRWRPVATVALMVAVALAAAPAAGAQATVQTEPAVLASLAAPAPALAPAAGSLLHRITPSFSVAPRSVFRRRGPRGAKYNYESQTVWLSANVHDMLPRSVATYWPSPVRLSVGRRGLGAGLPGEYAVGLDLDASRLPGTHPVWMQTKRVLHAVRLPGPAIVMGPNGTRALGLYW